MGRSWLGIGVFVLWIAGWPLSGHAAPLVGTVDTFEDGTTQGWLVALLGAPHPAPPVNVPTGGPAGADDNFLLLTAIGGAGAGSRLSVLNLAQWAGDYLSAGITGIAMDVRNLGGSDLSLRLLFENPRVGPPTDMAISADAVFVPAGGDWTPVFFPIGLGALTALRGSVATVLGDTTAIRIVHNPVAGFPPPPVAAQLGVDNITAVARVPEPSVLWLLAAGVTALRTRSRLSR